MSNHPEIYYEDFTVRHSDGMRDGRCKLRSLMDFLQEGAANHAALLGLGMTEIAERNQIWVLSQLVFELKRLPKVGEKLQLRTWPSGFQRLYARREYCLSVKETGEVLLISTSYWLLLDAIKLRPLRVGECLKDIMPLNENEEHYYGDPVRMSCKEELPLVTEIQVPESGIDVNGHLNNAEYGAMIHNVLALWGYPTPCCRSLTMEFAAECKSGETLYLHGCEPAEDGEFTFYVNKSDGRTAFIAKGVVEPL